MAAKPPRNYETPLLNGDFEIIQDAVLETAGRMRMPVTQEGPKFGVKQDYELYRVASRGVLNVLHGLGVKEAQTLQERLDADAADDWVTDMHTVAADMERSLFIDEPESFTERFETKRLALLAQAIGGTAHVTADITLGRSRTKELGHHSGLARARGQVLEYEGVAGVGVESNALHSLLDAAEAAEG